MADIDSALMVRLEASLAKFEKQMARARQVGSTTATTMQKDFDRVNTSMAASSAKAATALTKVVNISAAGRFVLQNTAAQIGDVAVQLQGGTSAAKVMAQQLPQIFGGFSALGGVLGIVAPLLGTLAAVGIPVVAMLLSHGESADEAAKKTKSFADKLREAQSAVQEAEQAFQLSGGGADVLLKRYGQVNDKVRELAEELERISRRAAEVSIGITLDDIDQGISKQFESLFGTIEGALTAPVDAVEGRISDLTRYISDAQAQIDELGRQNDTPTQDMLDQLRQMKDELALLQGRFEDFSGITDGLRVSPEFITQIRAAQEALAQAHKEGNFDGMANALATIRDLLQGTGQVLDQDLIDKLVQAEDVARQAAKATGEITTAAGGIGGALEGGIAAASALADQLGRALKNAQNLAAQSVSDIKVAQIELDTVGKPVERAKRLAAAEFDAQAPSGVDQGLLAASGFTEQRNAYIENAGTLAQMRADLAKEEAELTKTASANSRNGSGLTDGLKLAEQYFEQTRTKVEKYAEALRKLDSAYKASNGFDGLGGQDTYNRALQKLKAEFGELPGLAEGVSSALRKAFDGIFDDPQQALENLAKQLAQMALYRQLAASFPSVFGATGVIPLVANATGGVYGGAGISAYSGKVVSAPTIFPFAKGAGLMGEAGPEAIMPLTRIGGRLGVAAAPGSGTVVNVINNTGQPVREERQTGPDGRETLRVFVGEEIGKGAFSRQLAGRYSIKDRVLKR